ncbi:hypothetical protein VP01_5089g1 [Puccinia sorghi]|uniref:Uncharacterized protein n=1 Tax=Puccinia sorghi TaxID=27349 RepID=A0A0L6ULB7_9BASI|nr:hypothetical protein VP01_5089g1 [Puccinia sorghi]
MSFLTIRLSTSARICGLWVILRNCYFFSKMFGIFFDYMAPCSSLKRAGLLPSPVENWYNPLFIDNTHQQGELNIYADVDTKDFFHPTLLSVCAFVDGLAIFGDKFMKENAKWALAVWNYSKGSRAWRGNRQLHY